PAHVLDLSALGGSDAPAIAAALRTVIARGERAARPQVVDLLGRFSEPNLLAQALSALIKIGERSDVPAVFPLLKSEDGRVRANAVEAVEALGDQDQKVMYLSALTADPVNR